MASIFGYLSGVAILASYIPYIRDIFLNKTKPERMSWLIWAILGGISFFSQFAKGASWSLILSGGESLGELIVFFLAIKYGLGGFMKRDFFALAGAILGLILWYLTNEPAVALFIVIAIDMMGSVLTVIKSYENPGTETVSGWVLTLLAGVFGCLAVGSFNFVLLAFPLYVCLGSSAVLLAMRLGVRNKEISSRS